MKILFAASEITPFAKTGGLADVAGSIPLALSRLGYDIRLVMPRYRQVDPERFGLRHAASFYVPLGTWKERCSVFEGKAGGSVPVYFINKDIYFDRPELYGTSRTDYADNAERFIFFSRSILELCNAAGFRPDIIHLNDWQTGLVALYLRKAYSESPLLKHTKTVFTIHNLGYQGIFWRHDLRLIGLGWDIFTPEGIEFWGNINFLKAGLVYSDAITTVSKTYSHEIQTAEYGHGLEGVLQKRSKDIYGIVNGIDYNEWDPSRDGLIARTFTSKRLSGKTECKRRLMNYAGLEGCEAPLLGLVTRLTEQKGLDILSGAVSRIIKLGCRVVILGRGDEKYHRILSDMEAASRGRIRLFLDFDDGLAHAIYAGSDMFLMPSRYEPCGLGQMIAQRYGTVPVVRRTGGLADTVVDYNARTGKGTGFLFGEYTAEALAACVRRALDIYSDKKRWAALMRTCMKQDFSWERSVMEYEKLYRKVMGRGAR